jgi:hypothetical protein
MGLSQQHSSDGENLAVSRSTDQFNESVTALEAVRFNCTPASCVKKPRSISSVNSHDGSCTSAESSGAFTPSTLEHTIWQPTKIEATVPAPLNAIIDSTLLGKMYTLLFVCISLTSRYRQIFRTCSY